MVTVIGYDASKNISFGHAVVMTECTCQGFTVTFKLKNSLDGEHLKGSFDMRTTPMNLSLTKTKAVNQNIRWSIVDFDAWIIRFN